MKCAVIQIIFVAYLFSESHEHDLFSPQTIGLIQDNSEKDNLSNL